MWWYTSQAMLGVTLHISTSQRRIQRSLAVKITHRQLLPPSTCGTGNIIRAQERLMSHEQANIVLGGRGVRRRPSD